MDNGCKKCALLDFDKLCIDCQLEQADYEITKWMGIRAELEKKKDEITPETHPEKYLRIDGIL